MESLILVPRRHVFRDLRPYVCTFPGCLSPQKQYLTRHDWIYHEQQMHRRQWVCSGDCQQKFPTKDCMIEHLHSAHSSSPPQHQLPMLIEMSERPIDEDEILPCPLCPSEMYLSRLQPHLAEHLETISLFVLPNEVEESEDTDSDKVAWTGSKPDQNETGTQATLSSLGFSQTDEKGQTKENFSKLLSMEETQGKVKCETWGADEAISAAVQKSNTSETSIIAEGLIGPGLALPQQESPQAQSLPAHLRLGKEHPDTLTSMANLASTYLHEGRWDEAEKLQVQVMETSLKVLGAEHPDTLTSMANLAATYCSQGRLFRAEKLQVQVMETRLKVLGAEHPYTLRSMAGLASTYKSQGRLEEAEKLLLQVMERRKRILEPGLRDTMTGMSNVAPVLEHQGKYHEAEKIYRQLLMLQENTLGDDHHDTLTSMGNLARVLSSQGKNDEAESLLRAYRSFR